MVRGRVWLCIWIAALGGAAALGGCATFSYRDVQRDFNEAVQADNVGNVRTLEALGALTGGAEGLYESVRQRLTTEAIGKLDARLQPNAFALRAIAEWRVGKLAEARATAQEGLRLSNVTGSPRDEMVLRMIPALVIDEQLVGRFRAAGQQVSKQEYDERYAQDFATASDVLKDVMAAARPATPDSILRYVVVQRWRVLQNWRIVISKIQDGPPARQAALQDASSRLGGDLPQEIEQLRGMVPPDDPLRKLMEILALR